MPNTMVGGLTLLRGRRSRTSLIYYSCWCWFAIAAVLSLKDFGVESLTSRSQPISLADSRNDGVLSVRGRQGESHRHIPTLSAKSRQRRFSDDGEDDPSGLQRSSDIQRSVDRPTQTVLGVDPPDLSPTKPKVVVLGATGQVGRLVVQQLLEMTSVDMTVVAFVRDYDKAIRVLYDDMIVAKTNKKGPKLQIVEGNLVPPEELPGFSEVETEDERVWKEAAESAAKFFGNKVDEYNNRELLPDVNEALEGALKGCTTVISCVGALRPTNLWTDVLERPFWRLLRSDVSRWCEDGRHPYYVHYAATRKALGYVESEQRRREAAAAALIEGEEDPQKIKSHSNIPKIRFIRISDLGVGHKPWQLVPLITNVVQSVVFRYHEMTEQLLAASSLIDTIVLRPGDFVNEERDVNTTSVQVSHTGLVPSPACISREDVASLAVAAAMFKSPDQKKNDQRNPKRQDNGPFHYTLACRWVGQELNPYPAQGKKTDGAPTPEAALKRTLNLIGKNERRLRLLNRRRQKKIGRSLALLQSNTLLRNGRMRCQPHGICAAIPLYVMLVLFSRSLMYSILQVIPGGRTILLPTLTRLSQRVLGASYATLLLGLGKLLGFLPSLSRQRQFISF